MHYTKSNYETVKHCQRWDTALSSLLAMVSVPEPARSRRRASEPRRSRGAARTNHSSLTAVPKHVPVSGGDEDRRRQKRRITWARPILQNNPPGKSSRDVRGEAKGKVFAG